MIIVMDHRTSREDVDAVIKMLASAGYGANTIYGVEKTVIGAVGVPDEQKDELREQLEAFPFVERVIAIMQPYKLAARQFHPEGTTVAIGNVELGGDRIVVMAGPCTVENFDQTLGIASAAKASGARILRGGAYKPSTSPYAFQGLGEDGLKILADVGHAVGMPVVTEVMDPRNVVLVARYSQMLQVGTRNMQNYDLLREIGLTRHPVLLKRGMWARIDEWLMAAEYIMKGGNMNVVLCERGIRTFETATRNTLDLSAVALVKQQSHLPVIVDPSHATGKWSLVAAMSRGALAVGADGLIIEVHPEPQRALKDGMQSLTPDRFDRMMQDLRPIAAAVNRSI